MKSLYITKFTIDQAVFGEWTIQEHNGITYLYPVKMDSEEIITDFFIEDEFIEKTLNLCRNIEPYLESDLTQKLHIPYEITHTDIKDENYPFYQEKGAKERINTALLDIFNNYGVIPLNTAYQGYIKAIEPILLNNVPVKLPKKVLHIPFEYIVPVGLLAHTLYQSFYVFINDHKSQDFLPIIHQIAFTSELKYSQGVWSSIAHISNMYEALKLYLINDRVSGAHLVRRCEYCKKIFVAENPKKVRCSKVCTNRANVKKNYDKRKVDKNADT